VEPFHFLFPSGESISFEGEFIGGLERFVGRLDIALYKTEDSYVIILSRSLKPQRWFEYESPDEVMVFLINAIAQVGYELTGTKSEPLKARQLEEFLTKL
jgi:hypothetical protein